ncbi:hypothetical protein FOMPIDRAFT_94757 [Fomitopsis schrenkii]|uniref:Uncharacterized protein n=1 Tax=Fomitopsis schrenkii TaxID=2126942 RepID=S8DUF9_FOMSC|nr:hypothetical protein FOMPIDRAFT_94757 [Fomitopsis schrenkii]
MSTEDYAETCFREIYLPLSAFLSDSGTAAASRARTFVKVSSYIGVKYSLRR